MAAAEPYRPDSRLEPQPQLTKVPPGFERRQMTVNGADVVLFVGGSGEPLVFLHGAGTVSGFNFAASWAQKFKVYLPYHPGFGESPDSAAITSIDDYVLHYLELLDHLELDKVRLVGSVSRRMDCGDAGDAEQSPAEEAGADRSGRTSRAGASDHGHLSPQAGGGAGVSRPGPRGARALCARSAWSGLSGLSRERLSRDVELCPTGVGAALRPEARQVAAPDQCADAAALRRQGPDHAGAAVEDVGGADSERETCTSSRTRVTSCWTRRTRRRKRFWTFCRN